MKIMFYTASLLKGGAERVISVLANALVKKYEVVIVINTFKGMAYTVDENVKLIQLDKKREKLSLTRNMRRIKDTEKIVKNEKPDIIISFLPVPSYRILYLKRKLKNIPIIIADRNDPKQEYKSFIDNFLMKRLYHKADNFVFQTSQQRDFFPKDIRDKSTIICNPLKNEFAEIEKDAKIQKKKTIINVARLQRQKNQKLLINAFAKIAEECKDYNLKIFGQGILKEDLEQQIDELGLKERVKLCGVSDDIKSELEKASLFVLSSDYEGMPNALMEAMAVGLPVISTDCPCGGPKELINNKENGILVPVNDEQALAESMKMILKDNKYAKKLGENAQKIVDKLKEEKIVDEWIQYINKILQIKE